MILEDDAMIITTADAMTIETMIVGAAVAAAIIAMIGMTVAIVRADMKGRTNAANARTMNAAVNTRMTASARTATDAEERKIALSKIAATASAAEQLAAHRAVHAMMGTQTALGAGPVPILMTAARSQKVRNHGMKK
jgi:hypothetical protein